MIAHDSITHAAGVSHRWTDEEGFAYVWHCDADARRGSVLMVGATDTVAAGPRGWVMPNPQRVYVPTWGVNGPLIYGATSFDPATAWHDESEVEAVVRDIAENQFTTLAGLFQLHSARFLGNADGQYVVSQGGWEVPNDGDRAATIDPAAATRHGFVPGETDVEPLPMFDPITGDSLADEIRKVLS